MALQGSTKEKTRNRLKEPKQYQVIMHNDDFTTMEFVVEVLIEVFHKKQAEAEQLMMDVHRKGSAVVGIYPRDIARTRIAEAVKRARQQGFPFRLTMEEV
ncbi:MAG: ATP-dependent Clp protease adaptor ClpS [Firmicutes bacterium]|nr:ATP-dependent Clp protease adaptor ClpS [Bacillota bacterium]